METENQSARRKPCCKVGQVLRNYGLEALDAEFVRRWTEQDSESASLRELKRDLNRELLQSALTDAGVHLVEGEAENLRRVLRSSDVSESQRVEVRRRLENDGVDVEQLLDDFVSHQTIYNHLRNCQDATAPEGKSDSERLSQARETVFGLQNRTEIVTAKTLSQLGANDLISPADFDIVVDIQAICNECGRSNDISDLFTDGGCHCQKEH